MIVVAIIGILAAIAIPNFLRFQAKSKQSEAKSNLAAIFTGQVSYFGEHNTYGWSAEMGAGNKEYNCFQLIAWAPAGNNRYRYYCATEGNVATHPGIIPARPRDNLCDLTAESHVSRLGFTIYATGNVDNDPWCDVWGINDAKVLKNQYTGATVWGNDANDVMLPK